MQRERERGGEEEEEKEEEEEGKGGELIPRRRCTLGTVGTGEDAHACRDRPRPRPRLGDCARYLVLVLVALALAFAFILRPVAQFTPQIIVIYARRVLCGGAPRNVHHATC